MKSEFEISLNIKTIRGMETYGCFKLGSDEKLAVELYASLSGDEAVWPESVITIDLIKRENGLLFPLGLKHCSYDQLGDNVKTITRELFKRLTLEG